MNLSKELNAKDMKLINSLPIEVRTIAKDLLIKNKTDSIEKNSIKPYVYEIKNIKFIKELSKYIMYNKLEGVINNSLDFIDGAFLKIDTLSFYRNEDDADYSRFGRKNYYKSRYKTFCGLSDDRKRLFADFLVWAYDNNEKILFPNIPDLKEIHLSNIEYFLYYLNFGFGNIDKKNKSRLIINEQKSTLPSDKIKNEFFRKFINDKIMTNKCPNMAHLDAYIKLLNNDYSYQTEAIDYLLSSFEMFNSYSMDFIKNISDILKVKPENKNFYRVLKEITLIINEDHEDDPGVYIGISDEDIKRLQNNTNIKDEYCDYLEKRITNIQDINDKLKSCWNRTKLIKSIGYGEIKSLEELIEINHVDLPYYLLIAKIGEGGTRDVYKVIHEQRNHVLALKLDKKLEEITNERAKEVLSKKQNGELSKRERLSLMKLTHHNIARMWDFGEYDNKNYIVEDYVDGYNLEKLVKTKGPLNTKEFILLSAPLFRALRYLQQENYVHRDIKPNNIMISKDFKVVKLTDLQNCDKINKEGIIWGSSYGAIYTMSPEIILENKASFSSDIYSLGASLYFSLLGEFPDNFRNKDIVTIKKDILDRDYIDNRNKIIIGNLDKFVNNDKSLNNILNLSIDCYFIKELITYFIRTIISYDEIDRIDAFKIHESDLNKLDKFYTNIINSNIPFDTKITSQEDFWKILW